MNMLFENNNVRCISKDRVPTHARHLPGFQPTGPESPPWEADPEAATAAVEPQQATPAASVEVPPWELDDDQPADPANETHVELTPSEATQTPSLDDPPAFIPTPTAEQIEQFWDSVRDEDRAYILGTNRYAAVIPDGAIETEYLCPGCESKSALDVTIHDGKSVRRDCAVCGEFLDFMVWYGTTRAQQPALPKDTSCPWCGGRKVHHEFCVTREPEFDVHMPWGKYKERPLRDVPVEYLQWCLTRPSLESELRSAIEKRLNNAA